MLFYMRSCFAELHFIRTIYSGVHCARRRSALTTRQIRCRRSVFQQRIEHGIWPPRYSQHSFEDHHWSRRRLHAFRSNAFATWGNRFTFRFAINCAGGDAHTGTAAVARSQCGSHGLTGWFARCFASCFAVQFAEVAGQASSLRGALN